MPESYPPPHYGHQQYSHLRPPHYDHQQPPQWAPPAPPVQIPAKMPFWRTKKAAGLLLIGALMAACGLSSTGSTGSTTPSSTWSSGSAVPAAAPQPAEPAASGPRTAFSAGTYEVGVDIEPGKYKTTGPDGGSPSCYWARLKNTDGDLNSIIANGNAQGPATVTIGKSDKAFETTDCTWTKAG